MAVDAVLLDIAPEMAAVDPERRARVIALAELQVGAAFGALRDLAVANLAAHILTLAGRGGAGGSITSESEGGLSRSYGGAVADQSGLAQTSYGMEYVRLRRGIVVGVMLSGR